MDILPNQLLDLVERYLGEHTEVTPTVFGIEAVKDPKFVFDLRKGRECRQATRERVLQHLVKQGFIERQEDAA